MKWYYEEKIEVLGEKPVPVPLRQPQIHIDFPGVQPLPLWSEADENHVRCGMKMVLFR